MNIPGDATTTARLELGQVVSEVIDTRSDEDWFRFAAAAGSSTRFLLTPDFTGDDPIFDQRLTLRDADGAIIAEAGTDAFDVSTALRFDAGTDTEVFVAAGAAGQTGAYVLTANAFLPDVGDEPSDATPIRPGDAVEGFVDSDFDIDVFLVDGLGERNTRITVTDTTPGQTFSDIFFEVVDATGDFINFGEFVDDVSQTVVVQPAGDEPQFLRIEGFLEGASYAIVLEEFDDDVPSGVGTTATVGVDETVQGAFSFDGDEDWYRFDGAAGQAYEVALAGETSDLLGFLQFDLTARNADGAIISEAFGDQESPARILFTAPDSGDVFISAESGFGDPGLYSMVVSETDLVDTPSGPATPATITTGEIVADRIDFRGDADTRRIDLAAGVAYIFQLRSDDARQDGLGPAIFSLLDEDGGFIAERFPFSSADATILYRAPEDQTVLVEVAGDDFGDATTGDYTLKVVEVLRGTIGPDNLTGGDGDDVIDGGGGANRLSGEGGDDSIEGGDGDDTVDGGDGDDTVKTGDGGDEIDGGAGADVILAGNGDDVVRGGDGDDNIKPGRGNDTVVAGDGDDVVAGFRGDERFEGGEGNDRLLGSVDDVTLIGGPGDDRLWGGPGFDVFVFEQRDFGRDTLPLDMRVGSDTLDFTAIDGLTRADFTIRQVASNVVLEVDGGGSLVMNGVRFGGLFANVIEERFDEFVLL